MGCEIAEIDSTPEQFSDEIDYNRRKTVYLHLMKFFRGTRFTFQPFLKSLQAKHKEGEIVCVSGKVSYFTLIECTMVDQLKNNCTYCLGYTMLILLSLVCAFVEIISLLFVMRYAKLRAI